MPQTKDEKDKNFYIKRIKNDLRVSGNVNIGKDMPYRQEEPLKTETKAREQVKC